MNDNSYIENGVYVIVPKDDYKIVILTGRNLSLNSDDDNVDVEVRFKNGNLFTATFFTIQNIKTLFEKNKKTGECDSGLYFYCVDMILVETLTIDVIVGTVENLIRENNLDAVFKLENT